MKLKIKPLSNIGMLEQDQHYKRPESVLVVVYTLSNEILALRRKKPNYFWQSVAGSLEWDETPEQAAKRELYEEAGLADTSLLINWHSHNEFLIYPMWRHRYAPGIISNKEHLFSLKLEKPCSVVLDPQEHSEYRWLSLSQAMTKISSHTNRGAIAHLLAD